VPLGGLVVACSRIDQSEPGEREPEAAAVVQLPPQQERALEARPRLRDGALRELEVSASNNDVRLAPLVISLRDPLVRLVEQHTRPSEVAAHSRDGSEVRKHVTDGRVARDLDERLQRLLEDHSQRELAGLVGPQVGDVDRGRDPFS
jgi:hypothetical protein